ncbi:hypothetical protein BV505_06850 [Thermomonas haemolytica]|nr:hypothetical protein BV505_06850 [Thermomonas haemolytica]
MFLALALGACTVSVGNNGQDDQPVDVGNTEQQKSVVAAAHVAAQLLDAGQFEQLWELSGPMLKDKTPRAVFVAGMKAMRGPLGVAGHREVQGFNFPRALDGVQGDFGLIGVETDFANAKAVQEKFVFQRVNGQWKLVGYWLSKKVTFGANTPNNSSKPTPLRGAA